jgi:subtilisin family serine protease
MFSSRRRSVLLFSGLLVCAFWGALLVQRNMPAAATPAPLASAASRSTAGDSAPAERSGAASAGAPSASASGALLAVADASRDSAVASTAAMAADSLLPEPAPVNFTENYVVVGGHHAHPHRLLGRVKEGAAAAASAALAVEEMGVLRRSALSPGDVTLSAVRPVLTPVASRAEAESRGEAMQRRIKSLLGSGAFDYLEPDYLVSVQQTAPSDAAFTDGRLWGLRNTGQNGGLAGADIDAVRAWGLTSGAAEVIVAVIDSGVRYTHADLAGQMWRNPGESGALATNGVDDDRDGLVDNVFGLNAQKGNGDPIDEHGHGTFCAGIIAAQADGGGPAVGVAPRVRIMACRFLDAQGTGASSDAIKCIGFAVAKGARILSNSWGGGGFSQAMFNAILAARAKGALFVAAAGNEGTDNDVVPSYPANYAADNLIAVAALDRSDKLADFSSYGANRVHLGAPGVGIYSTGRASDAAYVSGSGTSAAAPHVSGVAALVLSRFPGLPLAELRQRILAGAAPVAALRGKTVTGGRLNAYNALTGTPDGVLEVSVTPAAGTLVPPGSTFPVFVRVHDIAAVTNATVSLATGSASAPIEFRNNGIAPDATASDGIYSANVTAPSGVAEFTLKFAVAAPDKKPAELAVTLPLRPPPANDAFAKRLPLAGPSATATGNSEGATREAGEPVHAARDGGASLWWTWTAPASGKAVVTTRGSSFDTLLGIYTGTAVDQLARIAQDDDSGGNATSAAAFNAVAGTAYQIAVDGYRGAAGAVNLSVSLSPEQPGAAPANDAFANAAPLAGAGLALLASNAGATRETGEGDHAGAAGGASVWWRWTAPAAGTVTISTDGSSFDTLLAVYTGAKVDALTAVAADDDSGEGPRSLVTFTAVAGAEYRLAVDGKGGATGLIALRLSLVAPKPAPANDTFAARIAITGTPDSTGAIRVAGSNVGATEEEGEPDHAGNPGGRSVWWSWTAPGAGISTLSTAGSSFNTVLAVYTGGSLASLAPVSANDQDPAGGNTSRVSFATAAGVTYQIAVDGARVGLAAESGSIALRVAHAAGAGVPANDGFAAAAALTGAKAAWNGFNIGATAEAGEPDHAGRTATRSIWWTWTAPGAGVATVSTAGSGIDTVLAVYTGTSVSSLTKVVANDDDGTQRTSRVMFKASAGTTYRIAVDGAGGASGQISLSLSLDGAEAGPANDAFAAAAPVPWPAAVIAIAPPPPLTVSVRGTNVGASREVGEPVHAGREGGASVWWKFTAPQGGVLEINSAGTGFEALLALYRGEAIDRLTPLGSDSGAPARPFAAVRAFVTAGATYFIAVDGAAGAQGPVSLNLKLETARELYATHFDLFPAGVDKLVGFDGWSGVVDPGSSGISESATGSKVAWIGRAAAATRDVVTVRRPINYDPLGSGTPVIVFSADVVLTASANGRKDAFEFAVRNFAGETLGAVRFNLADLSVSRDDRGTALAKAPVALVAGEARRLAATIDFGRNRWSVTYGAETLWTDQPLTARTGVAFNLGDIAVSWRIAAPGSPGDNFLSFDNYRVAVAEPITLLQQPRDQSVAAGQPAVFSVAAAGAPPPQFQWQRRTVAESAFSDLAEGSDYAGVRSPVLTVKSAGVAMSGHLFRCVISHGQAAVMTSSPAVLTVGKATQTLAFIDPPRDRPFSPQPIELRAVSASGQPAVFSVLGGPARVEENQLTLTGVGTVKISASVPATDSLSAVAAVEHTFTVFKAIPVITWNPPAQVTAGTVLSSTQLNATAVPGGGSFVYQPAVGTALATPGPVQLALKYTPATADAAHYEAISVTRVVLVGGAAGAPLIVRQPVSQKVPLGAPVSVEVVAVGDNLAFQWFKDDVAVNGATKPFLVIAAFAASDAGTYRVEISGGGVKVASQPAILSLAGAEISAAHSVVGAVSPSSATVTIRNTLSYPGTPSGLGWSVLIPRGWSLAAVSGQVGEVAPAIGATDVLEWAWTTVPAGPVSFTYTLNIPAGESGARSVSAFVVLRGAGEGGALTKVLVRPDPLPVVRGRRHDVDVNGDGRISLIELTRLIELYNTRNGTARTGAYVLASGESEDGFNPEPMRASAVVVTLNRHHAADTDRDGKLSLMELTRVIELYNFRSGTLRTGDYRESDGTEDGFAPGP